MSNILNKEDQYKIYTYYVGRKFQLGTAYISPLPISVRGKQDRTSSFNIYESPEGDLKWKDFGNGEFSGDAIDFICHMQPEIHALPERQRFREAMAFFKSRIEGHKLLSGDLLLEQSNYHSIQKSKRVEPKPKIKENFTIREHSFWTGPPLKIDVDILVKKRVYVSAGIDWGDGPKNPSTDQDPAYVYDLSLEGDMSSWKHYRPLTKNKRHKWMSWNLSSIPFEGYFSLPDTAENLLILSSYKDAMVAEMMVRKYMNVDDWAFANPTAEGAYRSIGEVLKEMNDRFRNKYILLDGDSAGIKSTNQMVSFTKWNGVFLEYPIKTGKRLYSSRKNKHTKDITEVVENYNYKKLFNLFKNKI